MNDGFPELTDSFLAGQDIFYFQFNDVSFYVEDTEQEHFYFNILKKLFPTIKFEKIFPLNGKKNVTDEARANVGDKNKIYLVDLDFDEILGIKEDLANLFYLERYSIENYLFSKSALYEIIREKDPKLKNEQIDNLFNHNDLIIQCSRYLSELACSFVLIQKFSLGIGYFGLNPVRDFDFTIAVPIYKNNFIIQFFGMVEQALRNIDTRFTLKGQIKKIIRHFRPLKMALSNIPGKYILIFIKNKLESNALINRSDMDSLLYKLSKEVDTTDLEFLKVNVTNYMK